MVIRKVYRRLTWSPCLGEYIGANAKVEQLILWSRRKAPSSKGIGNYVYEPDATSCLDGLLTRYIESARLYQAVIENNASEQAAGMPRNEKRETDKQGDIIDSLQLIKQSSSVLRSNQEISEIVARRCSLLRLRTDDNGFIHS